MGELYAFDHESWVTLKQLKSSIDFMRQTDYKKYKSAIEKETRLFKYFLNESCL